LNQSTYSATAISTSAMLFQPPLGRVTGLRISSALNSELNASAIALSAYDNAPAESFWQGLKRETMYGKLFLTMRQARLEIFKWFTYYNAR
jgi:transposase InsO family protein